MNGQCLSHVPFAKKFQKMNIKKSAILTFTISMFFSVSAFAQKETKNFSVGFGIEAGIPTGSTADLYNAAAGLTVRLSYHTGPGFVTLTSGGIAFAPKNITGVAKTLLLEIPVRAGYKYLIQHRYFVMGELGYGNFTTYHGKNSAINTTGSGAFIGAVSAGLQFNAFEAGLRYGVNFKSNGGVFGLRFGFNF